MFENRSAIRPARGWRPRPHACGIGRRPLVWAERIRALAPENSPCSNLQRLDTMPTSDNMQSATAREIFDEIAALADLRPAHPHRSAPAGRAAFRRDTGIPLLHRARPLHRDARRAGRARPRPVGSRRRISPDTSIASIRPSSIRGYWRLPGPFIDFRTIGSRPKISASCSIAPTTSAMVPTGTARSGRPAISRRSF